VKILLKLFTITVYYPFYENILLFDVYFTHLLTIISLKYILF